MTRLTAKQKRERAMLLKLQTEHGYMFHEMPRAADRYMVHFTRPKTGKHTLTSARMMRVSTPADGWLATQMDGLLKAKPARKRRS